MSPRPSRLPCIDALKAVSSQLIVLQHLAFYGPMSDTAYRLAPGLVDWLYDYARIAVQVFLVISGFLAARSLAPHGRLEIREHPLAMLWRRYLKLVVPFAAALLLSIAGAALGFRNPDCRAAGSGGSPGGGGAMGAAWLFDPEDAIAVVQADACDSHRAWRRAGGGRAGGAR